jgi:hypothetical protein
MRHFGADKINSSEWVVNPEEKSDSKYKLMLCVKIPAF